MTQSILPSELRLALAMRGGVSLSVWIGGAVREIERFRNDVILGSAEPNGWPESALAAVARATGYSKVQIDVLSGASAGGLNAVILGAAMSNGRSLDMLRDVWLDAASIENLLYESSRTARNSILRGDYFLRQLEQNLVRLMESEAADGKLVVDRLDVFLSVTSVVSNELSAVLDPSAPVTEQRIDGQIHLRKRDAVLNEFAPARAGDLARAARSTAAFPVAFEPLQIQPDQLVGDVDFRPDRPRPLLLFDGGVTDNMPVGKAARAISSAPADGPTDRLLLYLHPSPGVPDAASAKQALENREALAREGARPFDVIRTTLRSLRTKSLLEDLRAIEAHNEAVEQQLNDRDRLLEAVGPPGPDGLALTALAALAGLDPPAVDVTAGDGVIAPELDATRLVGLFASPWDHVAEHVPPLEFAPQAGGRNGERLDRFTRRLAQELTTVELPRADDLPVLSRHSLRPWGAVIRMASLLIEWSQCAIEDAAVVEAVGAVKLELYDRRDDAVRRAAVLNVTTLRQVGELSLDDGGAAKTIVQRRRPVVLDQLDDAVDAWDAIAQLATRLSALLPRPASDGTAAPPGGELRRVFELLLPPGMTAAQAKVALDHVDVALLPLHRGEPRGSLERIRYLTISGNAGTPLADCFTWPTAVDEPAPRFTTVRPLPAHAQAGELRFDSSRSDASSKLAGNQLHNFSAFLERSWRANDWMWGQMDAAATLVDLVLDPVRLSQMSDGWRRDLTDSIRRICTGPLLVDGSAHRWSSSIVETAQQLWTDDVVEAVQAELLRLEAGSSVPPVTRTLLLWRRHVEIAAVEFNRSQENGPTGRPTPDTLAEGMGQWDATSRSLDDKWGEKKVTALGMRAVFVGWRTLFARVAAPLSLVRPLLAPVLAPLAGFVLCRRRTSFALEVFLLGCIAPRVRDSGTGRIVVGVLAVGFAVLWLWFTRDVWVDEQGRRRRKFDLFTEFWSLATLVAMAGVLVVLVCVRSSWFTNLLPTPALPDRGVLPYVLPVGAVLIVTFVTWYWAKLPWRLLVMVINSAIVAGWVWLGSSSAAHKLGWWDWVANPFGSFWWALVAMVLATTLLGYNIDVADLPDQPDE